MKAAGRFDAGGSNPVLHAACRLAKRPFDARAD
jgi:hypothetical protein